MSKKNSWKTISYSKLHLLACPYAAWLKYEAAVKGPTTQWIAKGVAAHTALEKGHSEVPFNFKLVVDTFKEEFQRIIEDENVAIGWPALKKMESESITMLEKYNDRIENGTISQTPLALEAEFKLPFLTTQVVGKIDKIEYEEGLGYIVTDYKTGATKPDSWFLSHDLQLTTYAWACQEIYGELPAKLIWHALAKDEMLETTRTQQDIDDLKQMIANALAIKEAGIKNRIFHEKVCGQCDYSGAGNICDDRDFEEEIEATLAAGEKPLRRIAVKPRGWYS